VCLLGTIQHKNVSSQLTLMIQKPLRQCIFLGNYALMLSLNKQEVSLSAVEANAQPHLHAQDNCIIRSLGQLGNLQDHATNMKQLGDLPIS